MVIPNYKTGLLALVLSAQGCLCVDLTQRLPGTTFRDVNGDGKADIVYCREEGKSGEKIYKLFWKENIGEGKFKEENLLFLSSVQPNDYCR